MVEVDSNNILAEPIKNQMSEELQRAYLVLLNRVKIARIVQKEHVLANQCLDDTKKLIRETCQLKLVQTYCHRRNVTQVTINKLKAHFIFILTGMDNNFLKCLWDKVLLQGELTIC